jgi:hypothetical protein
MGKRKAGKKAAKVEVKVEDQPAIKQEENNGNENLTEYELQRLAMYVDTMLFANICLGTHENLGKLEILPRMIVINLNFCLVFSLQYGTQPRAYACHGTPRPYAHNRKHRRTCSKGSSQETCQKGKEACTREGKIRAW